MEFDRFFEKFIFPKVKMKDLDLDQLCQAIMYELHMSKEKVMFCLDEYEKQKKIKILKIITINDEQIPEFLKELKRTNEGLIELDETMKKIEESVKK